MSIQSYQEDKNMNYKSYGRKGIENYQDVEDYYEASIACSTAYRFSGHVCKNEFNIHTNNIHTNSKATMSWKNNDGEEYKCTKTTNGDWSRYKIYMYDEDDSKIGWMHVEYNVTYEEKKEEMIGGGWARYKDWDYFSVAGLHECAPGKIVFGYFAAPKQCQNYGFYCIECQPGEYKHWIYDTEENPGCDKCPKGTYTNDKQQNYCKVCPAGYTTNSTGSDSEDDCLNHGQDGTDSKYYYFSAAGYVRDIPKTCPIGQGLSVDSPFTHETKWPKMNKPLTIGWTQLDYVKFDISEMSDNKRFSCQDCIAGKYSDTTDSSSCKGCPGGRWSDETALVAVDQCTGCEIGKYSDTVGASSNTCKNCPKGKYQNQTGQRTCKECSAGQYQNEVGKDKCNQCPVGYQNEANHVNCIMCTDGKYQNEVGKDECKTISCNSRTGLDTDMIIMPPVRPPICSTCPNGWKSSTSDFKCEACPAGTYESAGTYELSRTCTVCPQGQYQDQYGQQICKHCPDGQYQNQSNQTECTACSPGFHQDQTGQSSCKDCTTGGYVKNASASSCTTCPVGTYQNNAYIATSLNVSENDTLNIDLTHIKNITLQFPDEIFEDVRSVMEQTYSDNNGVRTYSLTMKRTASKETLSNIKIMHSGQLQIIKMNNLPDNDHCWKYDHVGDRVANYNTDYIRIKNARLNDKLGMCEGQCSQDSDCQTGLYCSTKTSVSPLWLNVIGVDKHRAFNGSVEGPNNKAVVSNVPGCELKAWSNNSAARDILYTHHKDHFCYNYTHFTEICDTNPQYCSKWCPPWLNKSGCYYDEEVWTLDSDLQERMNYHKYIKALNNKTTVTLVKPEINDSNIYYWPDELIYCKNTDTTTLKVVAGATIDIQQLAMSDTEWRNDNTWTPFPSAAKLKRINLTSEFNSSQVRTWMQWGEEHGASLGTNTWGAEQNKSWHNLQKKSNIFTYHRWVVQEIIFVNDECIVSNGGTIDGKGPNKTVCDEWDQPYHHCKTGHIPINSEAAKYWYGDEYTNYYCGAPNNKNRTPTLCHGHSPNLVGTCQIDRGHDRESRKARPMSSGCCPEIKTYTTNPLCCFGTSTTDCNGNGTFTKEQCENLCLDPDGKYITPQNTSNALNNWKIGKIGNDNFVAAKSGYDYECTPMCYNDTGYLTDIGSESLCTGCSDNTNKSKTDCIRCQFGKGQDYMCGVNICNRKQCTICNVGEKNRKECYGCTQPYYNTKTDCESQKSYFSNFSHFSSDKLSQIVSEIEKYTNISKQPAEPEQDYMDRILKNVTVKIGVIDEFFGTCSNGTYISKTKCLMKKCQNSKYKNEHNCTKTFTIQFVPDKAVKSFEVSSNCLNSFDENQIKPQNNDRCNITILKKGILDIRSDYLLDIDQCKIDGAECQLPLATHFCYSCSPGRYQNQVGTSSCKQCPAGKYQDQYGLDICKQCPAGKYQGQTNQASCKQCPAGKYQDQTNQASCQDCTVGKFQDQNGQSDCKDCGDSCKECGSNYSRGYYINQTAQTSCKECPRGFTNFDNHTGCKPDTCGKGYYRYSFELLSATEKWGINCIECEKGRYGWEDDAILEGWSDYFKFVYCPECSAGEYQDEEGQSSCVQCPVGTFLSTKGATSSDNCTKCTAGKYSNTIGATSSDDCEDCPTGEYQDQSGQGNCTRCPVGTFLSTEGATSSDDCTKCSAGKYSNTTGATSISTCEVCPTGEYQDQIGQSSCVQCPVGTFSNTTNATSITTCNNCTAGKWSGTGAIKCITCSAGKEAKQQNCQNCTVGKYSRDEEGQCQYCPAGQYQDQTGQGSCKDCTTGMYSNTTGLVSCISCTAGKYSDTTGKTACTNCIAGMFSQTKAATCTNCPQGYDSLVGQSICSICKPGYGQIGNSCQLCNKTENMYNENANSDQGGQCVRVYCDKGEGVVINATTTIPENIDRQLHCQSCVKNVSYNPSDGNQDECHPITTVCSVGTYVNDSEIYGRRCRPCAKGKFSSSENSATCQDATPGHYVPGIGASSEIPCDLGYVQPDSGSIDCIQCDRGTFDNGTETCQTVDDGYYAEGWGAYSQTPCPIGTYQYNYVYKKWSSAACLNCSLGSYQPNNGSSQCIEAAAGHYVNTTGATQQTQCPKGKYQAHDGSSGCRMCWSGKWSAGEGQTNSTTCQDCSPGFYSTTEGANSSTMCLECPAGKFENEKGSSQCKSCPKGKWSNVAVGQTSSTACQDCLPGFYSTTEGADSSTTCLECPAGTYEDAYGSSECKKCSVGKRSDNTGQTNSTTCQNCSAGLYSDIEGVIECKVCLQGYFCLEGSSAPQNCPYGTYQDTSRQQRCKNASVGHYVNDFNQKQQWPCPRGSSSDNRTGLINGCHECAGGTYTNETGQSVCTEADAGYYSNENITQTPCPAGTYTSAKGQSECTQCYEGYYQPNTGQSSCLSTDYGHYTNSSGSSEQIACLPGHYQDIRGQTGCKSCSKGRYQDESGAQHCKLAPKNHYVNTLNATSATACPDGKEQPYKGKDSCAEQFACPTNTSEYLGVGTQCTCIDGHDHWKRNPENLYGTRLQEESPKSGTCFPCPNGWFRKAPNNYTARLGNVNAYCRPADFGYYVSSTDRSKQLECPSGTVSKFGGTAECVACGETQQADADRRNCIAIPRCELGTYSETGFPPCTSCPVGSIAILDDDIDPNQMWYWTSPRDIRYIHPDDKRPGANQCRPCPKGYYSPTVQDACWTCSPGSTSYNDVDEPVDVGASKCRRCPAKTFDHDLDVSTECRECMEDHEVYRDYPNENFYYNSSDGQVKDCYKSQWQPDRCADVQDWGSYVPDITAHITTAADCEVAAVEYGWSSLQFLNASCEKTDVYGVTKENATEETCLENKCKVVDSGGRYCTACPQGKIDHDGDSSTKCINPCIDGYNPNYERYICEPDKNYYNKHCVCVESEFCQQMQRDYALLSCS